MKFDFMLQLLSAVNCWLKCMLLEPYNQTDHPECKSRPDSGLSAITELDPGYITGIFCCFRFPDLRKYLFPDLCMGRLLGAQLDMLET